MTEDPRMSADAETAEAGIRGSFNSSAAHRPLPVGTRRRAAGLALAVAALIIGPALIVIGVTRSNVTADPHPPVAAAAPTVPSARPEPAAPAPAPATVAVAPFQPVEVAIPALAVRAEVAPVSTRRDGQMAIPDDPEIVGWWERSALANSGSANTVLAGHIFNRAYGPGAFFHLQDAQPGDAVIVSDSDGAIRQYTVSQVEQVAKDEFPSDRVFTFDGPHQLVLATCGGTYEPATGRYHDNILVFAVLA